MNKFMNKLKIMREKAGIDSQKKLSEMSGVGLTSIKKYETDVRGLNKAAAGTLYRIAFALKCNIEDLIDANEELAKMSNSAFIGRKWGELDEEFRDKLLLSANCVDGRTGNNMKSDGECIVDLQLYSLSVTGRFVRGEEEDEINVNEDAVIYSNEG